MDSIKRGIKKGHKVPIPVVEVEVDGDIRDFQEGIHRAVAAFELKKRCIPIYIAQAVDRSRGGDRPQLW